MHKSESLYGKVKDVRIDSPSYKAGILPGDELISIDNKSINDILDYAYHSINEKMTVKLKRNDRIFDVKVTNIEENDIGISFEDELFDGCRLCANNCIFCFLKQMPKGMRSSLYVRDDDFRLSFVHGNYITLTNLTDADMDRIISQRMGPLFISVHTTDPELRTKMLNNKNAAKIMHQLKAFAEARISMHTQIVLCSGINDGINLEKSINDLAALYPWVESIAVVPVGLTKYRDNLPYIDQFTKEQAACVVESISSWQKSFKKKFDSRLVYASDEFYLRADMKFPSKLTYEGFPQYENGVGISRLFLDELKSAERILNRKKLEFKKYVLVTGMLAKDIIQQLADLINNSGKSLARVMAVKNDFFGESVTVAGLVTGCDIIKRASDTFTDEVIVIPKIMLNKNRFLDDITVENLQSEINRDVITASSSPVEFIKQLR